MRRTVALICALTLGVLCALLVSSCGNSGGGGISAANADELLSKLDEIERLANDGECATAADTATATATAIGPISSSQLDPKLKSALVDSFQRLATLAADPNLCGRADTTQDTTTDETTTQTTTRETPTVAPPTTTQSTTTSGTGGTGGGSGGISP